MVPLSARFQLSANTEVDTEEGLDKSMSLLYYSRMRFITRLLPLLRSSKLPAHVISVYAAGMESSGKLFQDDLSLRDPTHFGFANSRVHVVHMKTMFFERLAQQNPGALSLVHVYPSLVVTPSFYSNTLPLWFRLAWRIVAWPVKRFFSVPPEEIGARVTFLASDQYPARAADGKRPLERTPIATDGVLGGGAYAVNYDGKACDTAESYRHLKTQGFSDTVWEHTNKAFAVIEKGEVFKD